MKKIIFIGFFLFSFLVSSQTDEEDIILNSVLDELFKTDSLSVDLVRSDYLYTTFSIDDKVYFAGRNFGINQYSFTPNISYMRGQNFFLSLGSAYFSELNPNWDFISLSSGYSVFLDNSKRFNLTGIYSRIFFSADADELNPNRLAISLVYHKKNLRTRMSGGYLFGGSSSLYSALGVSYNINLVEDYKWDLTFNPELSFLFSQQTVSEQISSGFSPQQIEQDVFELINTKIEFPIELDFGSWDFEVSYNLNFPSPLISETNIINTSFFTFTIGYFVGL
ncbi:MAG: hypothetical protein CBC81_003480 [Flavobacteriaceae bacterium TMED121]|nr:MAG: hypothetical protein CBC81_003480 [Flavobacteriaceae bacterium TMED121]|tara:strand:- start:2088 stop:2924 length:837 start_codon:yes stop_codon:yes gene_type:complete